MAQTVLNDYSPSVQDYIKAVYKLQQSDQSVSTNDLARKVGTTAAAATKMIKHLAEVGLAQHMPYYGVRLTPQGERAALAVIRRHRLLELFLHEALGYTWDEVDAEAERLEHHISADFEARIDKALRHPSLDPHGDPIPSAEGVVDCKRNMPLCDVEPERWVKVERVGDSDPAALRYLAEIGIRLQARVHVRDKQPFNGPLALEIDGRAVTVGRDLAARVYVSEAA